MSYDPKCADLAEAFLEDYPDLTKAQRYEWTGMIAQAIQDAIEDQLDEMAESLGIERP